MVQNPHYAANFVELLKMCKQRNVAVQTIKALTRAPWGERPHTPNTWYQPFEDQVDIDLVVHWVLGEPMVFLNSVADIHLLPRVLAAVHRFQRKPSDDEMKALAERARLEPLFT